MSFNHHFIQHEYSEGSCHPDICTHGDSNPFLVYGYQWSEVNQAYFMRLVFKGSRSACKHFLDITTFPIGGYHHVNN